MLGGNVNFGDLPPPKKKNKQTNKNNAHFTQQVDAKRPGINKHLKYIGENCSHNSTQ